MESAPWACAAHRSFAAGGPAATTNGLAVFRNEPPRFPYIQHDPRPVSDRQDLRAVVDRPPRKACSGRQEAEFGPPPGEMTEWPPEIDRDDVGWLDFAWWKPPVGAETGGDVFADEGLGAGELPGKEADADVPVLLRSSGFPRPFAQLRVGSVVTSSRTRPRKAGRCHKGGGELLAAIRTRIGAGIDGTRPHPGPLPEGEGNYCAARPKSATEPLADPHAFRTGFGRLFITPGGGWPGENPMARTDRVVGLVQPTGSFLWMWRRVSISVWAWRHDVQSMFKLSDRGHSGSGMA